MKISDLPIAFTMGDPSGIGPEIIVKTYSDLQKYENLIFVANALIIQNTIKMLNLDFSINLIKNIEDALFEKNVIDIIEVGDFNSIPKYGEVNSKNGKASFDAIIKAYDLAKNKKIAGFVTAPINKSSLNRANIDYPGHTEILAEKSRNKDFAMMLINNEIRTVLVTLHCSLLSAISNINIEREFNTILLAYKGAKMLGLKKPSIAVSSLNPHSGEGGLFGNEEIDIIIPAIKRAQNAGIDVVGPFPGDTVFMNARLGHYDVVIAQYHDQGLIPIKYMGIEDGINLTLGIDVIRTSPDHGVAYDIAGKGIANHSSFLKAAKLIRKLKL